MGLQESQASAAIHLSISARTARSLTIAGEIPRSSMYSSMAEQSSIPVRAVVPTLYSFLRYHKDNPPEEIQKPLKSDPRHMKVCKALLPWNNAGS